MLSCRLYIRTDSNRRRFKDWHHDEPDKAIAYATEYAECLPVECEADLYVFNRETQRLEYTRHFRANRTETRSC